MATAVGSVAWQINLTLCERCVVVLVLAPDRGLQGVRHNLYPITFMTGGGPANGTPRSFTPTSGILDEFFGYGGGAGLLIRRSSWSWPCLNPLALPTATGWLAVRGLSATRSSSTPRPSLVSLISGPVRWADPRQHVRRHDLLKIRELDPGHLGRRYSRSSPPRGGGRSFANFPGSAGQRARSSPRRPWAIRPRRSFGATPSRAWRFRGRVSGCCSVDYMVPPSPWFIPAEKMIWSAAPVKRGAALSRLCQFATR